MHCGFNFWSPDYIDFVMLFLSTIGHFYICFTYAYLVLLLIFELLMVSLPLTVFILCSRY
jgi:hypothetical protein